MHRSFHCNASRRGFTLIEVMIVVAIVAILSTIAFPSYQAYVTRGNVPEATTRLATKQVQMEQHFQDNRTYVGGAACSSDTTSSKYFDFSCAGVSATGYTMSAVGKASMAGFTYTINHVGAKTSSFAAPSSWTTPAPNTCWVTKKGSQC